MTRPHIDYLQSQTLPWRASPWPHLPGCQMKTLSRDADSGAVSVLVRYPSGWQAPGAGSLATDEEFLVVDGAFEIDGRTCRQDCYAWLPAGARQAVRAAPDGAVVLAFYAEEPLWIDDDAPAAPPAPEAEPAFIDAYELPWQSDGIDPVFGGEGQAWKALRGSPYTDSVTMLLASPPHRRPPRWLAPQEIHSCDEELFVLSGDFQSNLGQLSAGAYVWRPAGVAHGPYGTRGGNLTLVRTHGAPLGNSFTPHEVTLSRMAVYEPVLPEELAALRLHPWRAQRY